MEILIGLITIGVISLLAAMSPGPDFVVVAKNSLAYSRKAGIFTSIGVGLGIFVHVGYSIIGIGFLISKSIILFNIIKLIGAFYLIYLGYKLLKSKKENINISKHDYKKEKEKLGVFVKEGFLVNALNPKATLFFLSLFTQVISPETSYFIKSMYGIEIAVIVFVWFVTLSFFLTIKPVFKWHSRASSIFSKVMGGILVALGVKVALSNIR